MTPPFEIQFDNIVEIRMGSPYNACAISFRGADTIKIPAATWQDKYAWSSGFTKLALVKWDFDNNDPGFKLFIIELASGKALESPRISGLLDHLSFVGDKIVYNKFLYDKERSTNGVLCCYIDEEFVMPA